MVITISHKRNQCILVTVKKLSRKPTKSGLKLQSLGDVLVMDSGGVTIENASTDPVYIRWA